MYIIGKDEKSFLDVDESSDFPIQNLPYGVFSTDQQTKHVGVAIGSKIFDLTKTEELGYFDDISEITLFASHSLNIFMAQGREVWTKLRAKLHELLKHDSFLANDEGLQTQLLVDKSQVEMHLPVEISEFTDFYSSYYHAYNIGSLIRGPENALMPNWKHLPVAYHGRSSSIILSGQNIYRPCGQILPQGEENPIFSPTKRLDFELEMGFFIGPGNELGQPIPINETVNHIFGMVLVNDWSARDVQVWEYRPLGPFLAKNFATSISPWVVTLDALEPFKTEGMTQDPVPMDYLKTEGKQAYDIVLEVDLESETMESPKTIGVSNTTNLYWNIHQQLAHHTITGCNTRTGDLMGSGTISGESLDARGCLFEMTQLGKTPISLTSTETRIFLEDGDIVTFRGYSQGEGYRVGFGEVTTQILPAH